MSESMTTSQIVKQVIDQLSDGVSELVLVVIVLSEQNAEVPETLPHAAGVVSQTATVLADIADELAYDSYSDFEMIQKRIMEESVLVRDASLKLNEGVEYLMNSTNRKTGWDHLINACRIMSAKTISLLQIVYGADYNRLAITFDRVKDAVNDIDTDNLVNDPQKFADAVGKAVSETLALSQYLVLKAEDEESPLGRENILSQAVAIENKANAFIDQANLVLQDYTNKQEIAKFNKLLAEICEISDVAQVAHKESADIRGIKLDYATLEPAVAKEKYILVEPVDIIRDSVSIALAEIDEIYKLEDVPSLVDYARSSKVRIDDVIDAVNQSKQGENMDELVGIVRNAFSGQLQCAKKILSEPDNEEIQELLKIKTTILKDGLYELARVGGNEKKLTHIFSSLAEMVDNPENLEVATLYAMKADVNHVVNSLAQATTDNSQRAEQVTALTNFNTTIEEICRTVENNGEPTARQVENFKIVVQKLEEATSADLLDKLESLKTDINLAALKSRSGDISVSDDIKNIKDTFHEISMLSDSLQNKLPSNSTQREAIKNYLDELEKTLDTVEESMQRLSYEPTKPVLLKGLNRNVEKVNRVIDFLSMAIANRSVGNPKQKSVYDGEFKEIKKQIDNLNEIAKVNPKQIGTVGNKIQNLLQSLEYKAIQDNPENEAVRHMMDDILSVFPAHLLAVQDFVINPTNEKLQVMNAKTVIFKDSLEVLDSELRPSSFSAMKGLQEAVASINSGDLGQIEKISSLTEMTRAYAHYVASIKKDGTEKREIIDLITDLDNVIEDILRDVVTNGDVSEKDILYLEKVMENLSSKLSADLVNDLMELKKTKQMLGISALVNNDERYKSIREDLDDMMNAVKYKAREKAIEIDDPKRKDKIQNRAKYLEDLLDEYETASRDILNSVDSELAQDYKLLSKKIDDNIDGLMNVIHDIKNDTYRDNISIKKETDSPISRDIKAAIKKIDDIIYSACNNPRELPQDIRELKTILEKIEIAIAVIAKENPALAVELSEDLDSIKLGFAQLIPCIRPVIEDPNDELALEALQVYAIKLKNSFLDLDTAAGKNAPILDDVKQLKKYLFKIHEKYKNGDEIDQVLKDSARDSYQSIKDKSMNYARLNADRSTRGMIKRTNKEIGEYMEEIFNDIEENIDYDIDAKVNFEKLEEKLEKLTDETNAVPLSALHRIKQYSVETKHSAQRRDTSKLVKSMKNAISSTKNLEDALSKKSPSDFTILQKRRLDDLDHRVKEGIIDLSKSSKNLLSDIDNYQLKEAQRDAYNYLEAVLEDLEDILNNTRKVDRSPLKEDIDNLKNKNLLIVELITKGDNVTAMKVSMNAVQTMNGVIEKACALNLDEHRRERLDTVTTRLEEHTATLQVMMQSPDVDVSELSHLLNNINHNLDEIERLTHSNSLKEDIDTLRALSASLSKECSAEEAKIIIGDMLNRDVLIKNHVNQLSDYSTKSNSDQIKQSQSYVSKHIHDINDRQNDINFKEVLVDMLEILGNSLDDLEDKSNARAVDSLDKLDQILDAISSSSHVANKEDFEYLEDEIEKELKCLNFTIQKAMLKNPEIALSYADTVDVLETKLQEHLVSAKVLIKDQNNHTAKINEIGYLLKAHRAVDDVRDTLKIINPKNRNDVLFDIDSLSSEDSSSDSAEKVFAVLSKSKRTISSQYEDSDRIVDHKIEKIKELMKDVQRYSIEGDAKSVNSSGKKLVDEIKEIKDKIYDMASERNKNSQESISSAIKILDNEIYLILSLAKDNLENDMEEAKLTLAIKHTNDSLMTVSKLLTPSLDEIIYLMITDLDDLVNVKRSGKSVLFANKKVKERANTLIRRCNLVLEDIEDVEFLNVLDTLLGKVQVGLTNITDRADESLESLEIQTQSVKELLEELADLLKTKAVSILDHIRNDVSLLTDSSKIHEVEMVRVLAQRVLAHKDDLKEAFKVQGNDHLLEVMKDLDVEIANVISVNSKLLEDNENTELIVASNNAKAELNSILDYFEDSLQNKKSLTEQQKDIGKIVNRITKDLPKLDAIRKILQDNPDDKRAKKKLEDISMILAKSASELNNSITDPEDKVALKKAQVVENLNSVLVAVKRGDPSSVEFALKELRKNSDDLSDIVDEYLDLLEEGITKIRIHDKKKDCIRKIEPVINTAKRIIRDISNEDEKNDLVDEIDKYNRSLNRLEEMIIPPKEKDEKTIRDCGNGLKKNLDDITLDNESISAHLRKIQNNMSKLNRASNRRIRQHPSPDEDVIPDIKNSWKHLVMELESTDPDLDSVTTLSNAIKENIEHLIEITYAEPIATIEDIEDIIDELVDLVDDRDPESFTIKAKELVESFKAIKNMVETSHHLDDNQRELCNKILSDLNNDLRDLMYKAKIASGEPTNQNMKVLKGSAQKFKTPLNKMKQIIDPYSKDRNIEAVISYLKNFLFDLSQDPKNPKIKENVKDLLADLIDKTNLSIANEPDELKKGLLEDHLERLSKILDEFDLESMSDVNIFAANLNQNLDQLLSTVKGDLKDAIINTGARVNNLCASISLKNQEMNTSDMYNVATDLSEALKNMIGNAKSYAKDIGQRFDANLSRGAKAALDLDDLLSKLTYLETINSKHDIDLDTLMNSLATISSIEIEEPEYFSNDISSDSDSECVEAVMEKVATQIEVIFEETVFEEEYGGQNIAIELRKMANCARTGQKQGLLMAGRNCSASLKLFHLRLKETAMKILGKNMREKRLQDNLYMYAQGLDNFSTQLKILSSVKAASVERDRDTDESMSHITRSLGKVISEAMGMIDIVEKTVLKQNK